MAFSCITRSAEDTQELADEIIPYLAPGTVVLLEGPLGAGKTTFVRGVLRRLGWKDAVRSPSFNLLQEYPTTPPLLHADLYRLTSTEGLDLEDYLDTHCLMVEWPHAGLDLFSLQECWRVLIDPSDEARIITILPPKS